LWHQNRRSGNRQRFRRLTNCKHSQPLLCRFRKLCRNGTAARLCPLGRDRLERAILAGSRAGELVLHDVGAAADMRHDGLAAGIGDGIGDNGDVFLEGGNVDDLLGVDIDRVVVGVPEADEGHAMSPYALPGQVCHPGVEASLTGGAAEEDALQSGARSSDASTRRRTAPAVIAGNVFSSSTRRALGRP